MKTIFIFLVAFALSSVTFAESYQVKSSQSSVNWLAKKITGQHHGTISLKEGTLEVNNGKPTGGTFVIDMNTIVCEDLTNQEWNQKLIGHLKSDDFFSVEKFPTSKFVITEVEAKGNGNYLFNGNLTIKGITHPANIEANVDLGGNAVQAKGKLVIDRTLYNVRYGSGKFFDNLGDKTIDDEFTLDFNVIAGK